MQAEIPTRMLLRSNLANGDTQVHAIIACIVLAIAFSVGHSQAKRKQTSFYVESISLTRPIRPTMSSHVCWNDCMMVWFMTCSAWVRFIDKGRFTLNSMELWQIDRPRYAPTFLWRSLGFICWKTSVFPVFFLKHRGWTDQPTDRPPLL